MTINLSDNSPRISYTVASGVTQSSFTVPFEFFEEGDLNVYVDGTLKTITTHYTVSGGSGATGTIAMTVVGASGGSTVVLTRSIPLERTTDFPTSGPFDVTSLNEELDRITAINADLNDEVNRSLRLTDADAAANLTLPTVASRAGKVLAFDLVTGDLVNGPSTAGVTTVAAMAADIATLADIEDGTVATDAISDTAAIKTDVTTVAGIASNVTTVASNNANVTTVAGINADVTTVAGNNANVTTVAGISGNVTTAAGISADITAVAADATDIGTVSTNIANVNTVAGISADVTTVAADGTDIGVVAGISSDVTTVSGIAANVTTVAGNTTNINAVAADATDIGTVATNIANVNTAAGISANITTVAGIAADVTAAATNASDISAIAAEVAKVVTVANDLNEATSEIDVVANNIANVNLVGADIAAVINASNNLADINAFGDTYFIAATAPSSPTLGDLWFDTSSDTMKVYGASGWQNAGSSVNGTSQRVSYIATSGQTSFAATYDAGYVDVYLNGIKLIDGTDFTATNGTSIVLASGAALNDTVDIVAYGTFNIAIPDISGDLTPELGGDLATSGNDITFGDNDKAIFGAGSDLQIYHDGSNSIINDAGTGSLKFQYGGTDGVVFDSSGVGIGAPPNATFGSLLYTQGTPAANKPIVSAYSQGNSNNAGFALFNDSGNRGIWTTGSTMRFTRTYEGNSTADLTIDASGNLGIGTSSPSGVLAVTDGSNGLIIGQSNENFHAANSHRFYSQNYSTEHMRIDSSGNLLVGTTSQILGSTGVAGVQVGSSFVSIGKTGTSSSTMMTFNNGNGQVGAISTAGSSTSYGTSSDYRLKTAVEYDWDATTRLKQLRPARFEWIADGDDAVPVDGFLAHEVQDIVPEAISGTHNGMRDEEYEVTPAVLDEDGNEVTPAVMGTRSVPDYQGIDQSKLVPLLVKTIQELEARIAALENV
jgi:hypothetical protein